MKKLLIMLCMLACVSGLSACGNAAPPTELEQERGEIAKTMATDFVIPYMMGFFDDEIADQFTDNYDVHDLEYIVENDLNYALYVFSNSYGMSYNFSAIEVEGNAILNGITSFNGTYASLGEVDTAQTLEASYELSNDRKTIIVTVPVTGSALDDGGNPRVAEAEIIFSSDVFLTVESCALNLEQSMSELMVKAAMDTLMGMGTVFVILILISGIIWALGGIPKLQARLGGQTPKEEKKDVTASAVDNTIAQIIGKEETRTADDLELVAVIAAAIAASEGAVSTDGFVVRSIRKRR